MKRPEAIKKFFNTADNPHPVDNKELISFAKNHREDYHEVSNLCAKALGVEIDSEPQA